MDNDELVAGFRELEEALWIPAIRSNPDWFEKVLSPNFTEHGKSGRVFTRDSIQQEMPDEIEIELPFPDFVVRQLSATVVLVTYTSIQRGNAANRSSIWSHNGTDWQLEFHTGVPANPVKVPKDALSIDLETLQNRTFKIRLRGYDQESVDAFLDGLAERVLAGEVVRGTEIKNQRFELNLRGYECEEVDLFLAALERG